MNCPECKKQYIKAIRDCLEIVYEPTEEIYASRARMLIIDKLRDFLQEKKKKKK